MFRGNPMSDMGAAEALARSHWFRKRNSKQRHRSRGQSEGRRKR